MTESAKHNKQALRHGQIFPVFLEQLAKYHHFCLASVFTLHTLTGTVNDISDTKPA